jgi:hypothetical protein
VYIALTDVLYTSCISIIQCSKVTSGVYKAQMSLSGHRMSVDKLVKITVQQKWRLLRKGTPPPPLVTEETQFPNI